MAELIRPAVPLNRVHGELETAGEPWRELGAPVMIDREVIERHGCVKVLETLDRVLNEKPEQHHEEVIVMPGPRKLWRKLWR
jgi:hypothetical protein